MITRKIWAISFSIAVLSAGQAAGQEATRPGVTSSDAMLQALDNGIWIADGKAADRQIYVISAPWCPVCRSLYQWAGRYNDRVQFRWIETGAKDRSSADSVADAAVRRDAVVLTRIYETKEPPPPADAALRENAVRCNGMIEIALQEAARTLGYSKEQVGGAYPVMVWVSQKGLQIQRGLPDRLDKIVDSVVPRQEAAAVSPSGLKFLTAQYRAEGIPQTTFFAKTDGVPMFAFPDAASLMVLTLKKGMGFPARRRVTANGRAWIELAVYTSGQGLFVREDELSR